MCFVNRLFYVHCKKYISAQHPRRAVATCESRSVFVERLIKEFTCLCGLRDWNIRNGCSCWTCCHLCHRILPQLLTSCDRGAQFCLYGCYGDIRCMQCGKIMVRANRSKFRVLTPQQRRLRTPGSEWLVCIDCVRQRRWRFLIDPVSKGFVAYLLIRSCLYNEYGNIGNPSSLSYNKIRDKEYIELIRDITASKDPDNPLLDAFT